MACKIDCRAAPPSVSDPAGGSGADAAGPAAL